MGPVEATSQSVKLVQICSNQFNDVQSNFWKKQVAISCNGTLQCHSFSKALPAGLGKEDTAWVNAFTSHRMVRIYAWNYTNIHERDRISIHLVSTLSGTKLLVLDKLNTRMQASGPAKNCSEFKHVSGSPKDICHQCPCTVASSLPSLAMRNWELSCVWDHDHFGSFGRHDFLHSFASFCNYLTCSCFF